MTLKTLPLSDGGGRLAYRVEGLAHGGMASPVVLLHGVGMQSAAWGPQMAALGVDRPVFALDLPGHGGSTPLPEGAELPAFVAWLGRALEALGIKQPILIGHSMGALIAGGFAVEKAARLERVVLLNGVFRRSAAARAAVESRAAEIGAGQVDIDTPLKRWFGTPPSHPQARAQVAGWLAQADPGGYATAYGAFARGDTTYADRFGQIACPLLALTGALDLNSTPAMSRAMAEAAPLGQSGVIAAHGHMMPLTASEAVNTALQDFLTTTPGAVRRASTGV